MFAGIRALFLSWRLRHTKLRRREIASALGNSGHRFAVAPLFEAICYPDWEGTDDYGGYEDTEPYVDDLKRLGSVAADRLFAMTTRPCKEYGARIGAALLLAKFNDPRAIDPLMEWIEDSLRSGSGQLIPHGIRGEEPQRALMQITAFKPNREQEAIISVLGGDLDRAVSLGTAAVDPLISAFLSPQWPVSRENCARALGRIRDERAVPVLLTKIERDWSELERETSSTEHCIDECVDALCSIGGQQALAALRRAAQTVNSFCSNHASDYGQHVHTAEYIRKTLLKMTPADSDTDKR